MDTGKKELYIVKVFVPPAHESLKCDSCHETVQYGRKCLFTRKLQLCDFNKYL